MLLVKTKLAPSTIHGIGLFAGELIPVGKEVWRFVKGFDLEKTPEELAELPLHIQQWIAKHFGYLDYHFHRYILPVDDARFINHSDNPNVCPDYTRDSYGLDVSLRDISIGEEITTDYKTFENDNWLSARKDNE
jgi:uncharacterized protein